MTLTEKSIDGRLTFVCPLVPPDVNSLATLGEYDRSVRSSMTPSKIAHLLIVSSASLQLCKLSASAALLLSSISRRYLGVC